MEIIKAGKLQVPLYHGTSTLFIESIVKNGLGAVAPFTDWGMLSFAEDVYRLAEEHLKHTSLWSVESSLFKAMIVQYSGNMDFRHDKTYLTASLMKACGYAENDYGSELVTRVVVFLKRLLDYEQERHIGEKSKAFQYDIQKKHPKHIAWKLLKARYCPVIIKVLNIAVDDLRLVTGEMRGTIETLRKYILMNTVGCIYSR